MFKMDKSEYIKWLKILKKDKGKIINEVFYKYCLNFYSNKYRDHLRRECKVCGSLNSKIEFDINDGKCFNCNTQLNK